MIKTMVDSREIDLDDIYALASVDVKEKNPVCRNWHSICGYRLSFFLPEN